MKFEFKDPNGVVLYLEVLGTFDHYFTKKTVYRCRVHDRNGSCTECTFDQDEFNEILEHRIVQPIGYVIFTDGTREEIVELNCSQNAYLDFSTKHARYHLLIDVYDDFSYLAGREICDPEQRIIFEVRNPREDTWYPAFNINRIEIRNWINKEKGK